MISAFAQPGLRLTRRTAKTADRFNVHLQTGSGFETTVDAISPPTANILSAGVEQGRYHFGFKSTFELWTAEKGRPRSHILQHTSLTVLENIPLAGVAPIFRAEWDPRAVEDAASKHAQPHWHFIQQAETIDNLVQAAFGPPANFGAESRPSYFTGLSDLDRFHFSMSTFSSQEGTVLHKRAFQSETELKEWFRSLCNYIVHQLTYVCGKSSFSASDQGITEEFGSSNR